MYNKYYYYIYLYFNKGHFCLKGRGTIIFEIGDLGQFIFKINRPIYTYQLSFGELAKSFNISWKFLKLSKPF